MASSDDITGALGQLSGGDDGALEALTPALYAELRRLAAGYLRRERPGHTLQPTALVNEAYLRLVGQRELAWQNRAQVIGVAANLMRRILVDHARARARVKRAGLLTRVTLDDAKVGGVEQDFDMVALDDALRELAGVDDQLSRVVELRYFGGLTVEEVAEVLGTSPRTVDRAWATARAWLRRRMEGDGPA
jgi:RNA polymerase sigma factor (TIGR02999 family)